jgi:hypothetical protein
LSAEKAATLISCNNPLINNYNNNKYTRGKSRVEEDDEGAFGNGTLSNQKWWSLTKKNSVTDASTEK